MSRQYTVNCFVDISTDSVTEECANLDLDQTSVAHVYAYWFSWKTNVMQFTFCCKFWLYWQFRLISWYHSKLLSAGHNIWFAEMDVNFCNMFVCDCKVSTFIFLRGCVVLLCLQNLWIFVCCFVSEKVVEPMQSKNNTKYYHRRYPRVKTIDQCEIGDPVCVYEAQEQYKRDK